MQAQTPTEQDVTAATSKPRRRQGFATMDPETRRRIASMGGKTAHAEGHAHRFTSEEGRAAGKVGGARIGSNRAHMATIGRLGGLAKKHPPGPQLSAPSETIPSDTPPR